MSTVGTSSKPYHHGHLKTALVDAAEVLLAEHGVDKLSLRAVARHTGVSQAAPYAHFDGRQALLAAVATRGFERLTACLHKAERDEIEGVDRTGRLARAYVAFALDAPTLFQLMFGAELSAVHDPALQAAAQASYAPIRAAVAEQAQAAGVGQWAGEASLAAWALVHGLATLIVDGRQAWPEDAAARNALVDRVVSAYSIGAMADSR